LKSLSNLPNGLTIPGRRGEPERSRRPIFNEEKVNVNIIKPAKYGRQWGFRPGNNSWTWTLSGTATAGWRIESGVGHFDITNGGTTTASVQLLQLAKSVIQGKKYALEFDAWSTKPATSRSSWRRLFLLSPTTAESPHRF